MPTRRRGGRVSATQKKSAVNSGSRDTTKEEAQNGVINQSSKGYRQNRRSWLTFAGVVVVAAVSVLVAISVARIGVGEGRGEISLGEDDVATSDSDNSRSDSKPLYIKDVYMGEKYTVLQVIPHDKSAFTQGLTFHDGVLYEGTGLHGESQLRKLNPYDGTVVHSYSMDRKFFGEGIAHFKDKYGAERIIQLTWREKTGFVYDAKTFEVLKEFTFSTATSEGWGITFDSDRNEFIVSDGSSWIFVWDGSTLEEKRRMEVKIPRADENGQISWHPVGYLNELEWVNGQIVANVWYQDVLLSINSQTGHVEKVWDFTNLYKNRQAGADCFNGISVSDVDGELFLTGKKWPHLYRIKLMY